MTDLKIKAADDSGEFYAYMAQPQSDQPVPAVIVIQEIFGINAVMREIADSLAQNGYMAVCPDLFWRQEPGVDITDKTETEWKKAFELFSGFNIDKGIDDIAATLKAVRNLDNCNGLVGTVGFCLGGKLAYLTAAKTDIDCSVSYYGVGIENLLDQSDFIKTPLMMHIASEDKFVSKEAQNKIHTTLEKNPYIQRFVYDGCNHAFARPGGEHYDADAAHLANMRTSDFLATHLGRDI